MTKKKEPSQLKSRGRPSMFTPEIGEAICDALVEDQSLVKVCLRPNMPKLSTVYKWEDVGQADIAAGQPDTDKALFCKALARAKERQADAIFESALVIADDGTHDMQMIKDKEGNKTYVPNRVNVLRSDLRVQTRLAIAERLNAAKYSKMSKLANADGSNLPPTTTVTLADVLAKSQNGQS